MWYLTDKKSIRSQHNDNDPKLYCDGRIAVCSYEYEEDGAQGKVVNSSEGRGDCL